MYQSACSSAHPVQVAPPLEAKDHAPMIRDEGPLIDTFWWCLGWCSITMLNSSWLLPLLHRYILFRSLCIRMCLRVIYWLAVLLVVCLRQMECVLRVSAMVFCKSVVFFCVHTILCMIEGGTCDDSPLKIDWLYNLNVLY